MKVPFINLNCDSVYAQYSILTNKKENIISNFKKNNIPYSIYYPISLHLSECFKYLKYKEGDFPIAEYTSQNILSLPMHPYLTNDEQDYICNVLKDAIN